MKVKKEIEEKWANKEKLDQKDLKVFMSVCWLLLVYDYQHTQLYWCISSVLFNAFHSSHPSGFHNACQILIREPNNALRVWCNSCQ